MKRVTEREQSVGNIGAKMFARVFFIALCAWMATGSKPSISELDGEPADESSFRLDYQFYPLADGWLKLHRIPTQWVNARLVCHLEGAQLASPINEGMAMVMSSLAQEAHLPPIHTGIHSLASVDDYFSSEGIPLSHIHSIVWADGEPNNDDDGERCLTMTSQGYMADVDCSTIRPFFCYKKKRDYITMNECGYNDQQYQLNNKTGSCYKFHTTLKNWKSALTVCSAEGGSLAVINSEAEAQVLKQLVVQNKWSEWVFLGFHNRFHEKGQWWTLEGTTLKEAGFEHWHKGDPNNLGGNEYCGSGIAKEEDPLLQINDIDCGYDLAFICEIPLPSRTDWTPKHLVKTRS